MAKMEAEKIFSKKSGYLTKYWRRFCYICHFRLKESWLEILPFEEFLLDFGDFVWWGQKLWLILS